MFSSTTENPLIKDTPLGTKLLDPEYLFDHGSEVLKYVFTNYTLEVVYVIFAIFAMFFIFVIIYTTVRMFEIREKEHKHLHHEIEEYAHNKALEEKKAEEIGTENKRWVKILDYLFSTNENDWRLAILEADTMLFDMLTEHGFKGDTLGDKLKSANLINFPSLNIAWEAHNTRNKIAHEGSNFSISLHEAERVIALYEQVFQDFRYI